MNDTKLIHPKRGESELSSDSVSVMNCFRQVSDWQCSSKVDQVCAGCRKSFVSFGRAPAVAERNISITSPARLDNIGFDLRVRRYVDDSGG